MYFLCSVLCGGEFFKSCFQNCKHNFEHMFHCFQWYQFVNLMNKFQLSLRAILKNKDKPTKLCLTTDFFFRWHAVIGSRVNFFSLSLIIKFFWSWTGERRSEYLTENGQILNSPRRSWFEFSENMVRGYVKLKAAERRVDLGIDHHNRTASAAKKLALDFYTSSYWCSTKIGV